MSADFQDYDFLNLSESVDFRPRYIYQPQSVADLTNFVQAANQNDRRVRAVGSAWTFPDVAVARDYLRSLYFFG
jgi:hypothetical protein